MCNDGAPAVEHFIARKLLSETGKTFKTQPT